MRTIILLSILAIALVDTGLQNHAPATLNLNGTWIPVKQEIGGVVLPVSSFQKQTLVISDSSYTFTAESIDKGIVKYAENKMDIYGKEGVNKGKHFPAIYKYEDSELTICYNLAGTDYPEDFQTKGKPAFFLCAFKKAIP